MKLIVSLRYTIVLRVYGGVCVFKIPLDSEKLINCCDGLSEWNC